MTDNCLKTADKIVHGSRNETYGDPKQNHETTAALFSEFMRRRYGTFPELTPEDVCWFNVCQKMSREAHCKTDDGLIDVCGYVANIEIVRKGWSISEKLPEGTVEVRNVCIDSFSGPAKEALEKLDAFCQSVHTTNQENPGTSVAPPTWCDECANNHEGNRPRPPRRSIQ